MELWHVVEVIGGGIMTVLAWIGRTQVRRIDQLERDKADRDSVADVRDAVEEVSKRMDAQHASIASRLDNVMLALTARANNHSSEK